MESKTNLNWYGKAMNLPKSDDCYFDYLILEVMDLLRLGSYKPMTFRAWVVDFLERYSSGQIKLQFPASSPSIRMFCPEQKRFFTAIK